MEEPLIKEYFEKDLFELEKKYKQMLNKVNFNKDNIAELEKHLAVVQQKIDFNSEIFSPRAINKKEHEKINEINGNIARFQEENKSLEIEMEDLFKQIQKMQQFIVEEENSKDNYIKYQKKSTLLENQFQELLENLKESYALFDVNRERSKEILKNSLQNMERSLELLYNSMENTK